MKATQIVLLAALAGISGVATAAYDGTRDDRMQSALDNYHRTHGDKGSSNSRYSDPRNPSPGPAARAETSMKRGASNAGSAIKRGAAKAGHAVGTGLHKTGEAIDNAGQKLKGKTAE